MRRKDTVPAGEIPASGKDNNAEALAALEKRVQRLENKLWVAFTVGIIFLGGAGWGWVILNGIQKKVGDTNSAITSIDTARNAAIADIQGQAPLIVKKAATDEMKTQLGNVTKWLDVLYLQAGSQTAPHWRHIVAENCKNEHDELGVPHDPGACRQEPVTDPNQ